MIRREPGEPRWRVWWRRLFATFLLLTLVIGVYLSYRPAGFDEEPDIAAEQQTTEPADGRGGEGDQGGNEPEATEPPAGRQDGEADDRLTDEEREALIAAARDPSDTTVQVLDAGGGQAAAEDAAERLRDRGYDVVAINASRVDYDVTTVLFTEGSEAEAEALLARVRRIAESAPNERLSDAVDLHVVVGPDWGG